MKASSVLKNPRQWLGYIVAVLAISMAAGIAVEAADWRLVGLMAAAFVGLFIATSEIK